MVEIKARGAAKGEFTNVNEHFAVTNNAEFGLFQLNLLIEVWALIIQGGQLGAALGHTLS